MFELPELATEEAGHRINDMLQNLASCLELQVGRLPEIVKVAPHADYYEWLSAVSRAASSEGGEFGSGRCSTTFILLCQYVLEEFESERGWRRLLNRLGAMYIESRIRGCSHWTANSFRSVVAYARDVVGAPDADVIARALFEKHGIALPSITSSASLDVSTTPRAAAAASRPVPSPPVPSPPVPVPVPSPPVPPPVLSSGGTRGALLRGSIPRTTPRSHSGPPGHLWIERRLTTTNENCTRGPCAFLPDGSELLVTTLHGMERWQLDEMELVTRHPISGGRRLLVHPFGDRCYMVRDSSIRIVALEPRGQPPRGMSRPCAGSDGGRTREENVTTHASDDFDPLERELCPDGTCIGLLGPDGFCKECGRLGRAGIVRRLPAPTRWEFDEPKNGREAVLTPDGTRLIVAGNDSTIECLDAHSGNRLASLVILQLGGSDDFELRGLAVSPDGRWLASSDDGGTHDHGFCGTTQIGTPAVRIWDLERFEEIASLSLNADGLAFSPTGGQLLVGMGGAFACVATSTWQVSSSVERAGRARHVGFLSDKLAYAASSHDCGIWKLGRDGAELCKSWQYPWIEDVAASQDGRRLAIVSGNAVRLIERR